MDTLVPAPLNRQIPTARAAGADAFAGMSRAATPQVQSSFISFPSSIIRIIQGR
ncbi:MAG: hypothetical protein V4634_03795 [Pseudomonadota bacterium]